MKTRGYKAQFDFFLSLNNSQKILLTSITEIRLLRILLRIKPIHGPVIIWKRVSKMLNDHFTNLNNNFLYNLIGITAVQYSISREAHAAHY